MEVVMAIIGLIIIVSATLGVTWALNKDEEI